MEHAMFQAEAGAIRWKVHFAAAPARVFEALDTDSGRAAFWAESARGQAGSIRFEILNYAPYQAQVLAREPPRLFALEYFGSRVTFALHDDGRHGTDLELHAEAVPESYRMEMAAGWVSVLMALKGAVDHGVDLRSHDPDRTWDSGYADN